jgi:hypothetical protein
MLTVAVEVMAVAVVEARQAQEMALMVAVV